MTTQDRLAWAFWACIGTSFVCSAAEVTIDRKPIYDAFAWGYEPHALAARIIAIPNAILALASLVVLGVLLVRWAVRKLAA